MARWWLPTLSVGCRWSDRPIRSLTLQRVLIGGINPCGLEWGNNMSGNRPSQALIEFRARNVRSYRDEVSLSLHATRLSNKEVVRDLQTASAAPERLLPVAGVFGANASGKSTIFKAMADMRTVVLGSFRQGTRDTAIHRHPFLLDTECEEGPSEFRVELILNGVWWQGPYHRARSCLRVNRHPSLGWLDRTDTPSSRSRRRALGGRTRCQPSPAIGRAIGGVVSES